MSEVSKALLVFHYVEMVKSELIMAVELLEALSGIEKSDVCGAEKIVVKYLNALIREVKIASNASKIEGFRDVCSKLEEVISQIRQHNYANTINLVAEAISIVTTSGSKAAEFLKEKDLI